MEEMTLSIGEVARRAGVPISTIRFYERRGLLPPVERVAGRRRFGPAAIRRLEVIAIAKKAGLSLAEIALMLDAIDRGAPAHVPLRTHATAKLSEIEAQIMRARKRREWLVAASGCECDSLEDCALFGVAAI